MKNIKFFGLLSIAALAISVSSCTNDNEPVISENETGNNTESGVFTIKANIGELQQTRATVKPEDGKSFTWIKGDKFDLYQNSDWAKKEFSIDDTSIGNDGKSADFNCDVFEPASGATYYAFYPQGFTITDNKTFTYTIPDDVYTQAGDNNTDHLKDGMIMIATGNSADIQNSVTFKHKTALFRFGISNLKSEKVTVKSIKLYSTDLECFAKQYTYNIDAAESISEKSKELSLSFGEGVTLDAKGAEGNIMKAYTLAIPADAIAEGETETFTLEVTYDEGTITNYIKLEKPFLAGYVYTFNLDIDYNRYYITGDYNGWGWAWNNCQYLYDKDNDGVYEGRVYFNNDAPYKFKITNSKDFEHSEWPETGDYTKLNSKSCKVKLENHIISHIDECNYWGVVGGFNNWGGTAENPVDDIVMQYGFDGDHYLIADVTFEEGDELTWKLRADNAWSYEIDSTSNVTIEGYAESANDDHNNFKVTAAGTYEFKWYFNLPEPKIVVTKK